MLLPARLLAIATLFAGTIGVGLQGAEDWPQWLGPRGDGISKEALPETLPADGLKKVWSGKVGIGFACPIGVDGVVYAFGQNDKMEGLSAFGAADGKLLWAKTYEMSGSTQGGYHGTRATPLFEAGKIYTLGEAGQMTCFDAKSGNIDWQKDILKETGAKNLGWGVASSPVLEGDRLYVQGGDGGPLAVGVDKKSGNIAWKSQQKGQGSYAHPILIDLAGTKELVLVGGKAVYGIGLADGKTLWEQPWETKYDVNATTPIFRDGHLLVSSGYGHGAMMLKVSAAGAEKEWESKEMTSKFPALILDGDYVYGNSEGKLKCLHWPDGKVVWTEQVKLNDGGSLLRSGDKLLALSERGKLFLLKADGETHKVLGETKLLDEAQVWATPLLYQGKIYVKGKEELGCYELK